MTGRKARPRRREPEARTLVFVYGTLLAGERNHLLLTGAQLVAEGRTRPTFCLHDLGGYPGLVSGGQQAILGEVYAVDEATLAALDRLEGHPEFYRRTSITLEDGTDVLTYILGPEKVVGYPVISSGSWRARNQRQ